MVAPARLAGVKIGEVLAVGRDAENLAGARQPGGKQKQRDDPHVEHGEREPRRPGPATGPPRASLMPLLFAPHRVTCIDCEPIGRPSRERQSAAASRLGAACAAGAILRLNLRNAA